MFVKILQREDQFIITIKSVEEKYPNMEKSIVSFLLGVPKEACPLFFENNFNFFLRRNKN